MAQCIVLAASQFYPTPDSCVYLTTARNLFSGKGYLYNGMPHMIFPPGYPILCGLVGLLVKSKLAPGLIVTFVFHMLGIWGMSKLAGELSKNKIVGGAVALAWALAGDPAIYSSMALTDGVFLAGLILLALGLMRPISHWWGLGLGAAGGYMALIRPEGMIFIIALPIGILWCAGRDKIKPAIVAAALSILAFAAVYAPYVVFLSSHAHKFTVSGKTGINLMVARAPSGHVDYARTMHEISADGVTTVTENPRPGSYIEFMLKRPSEWRAMVTEYAEIQAKHLRDATGFMVLLMAPFGIAFLIRRKPEGLWILAVGIAIALVDSLMRSGRRFLLPAYPGLIMAACLGTWHFALYATSKLKGNVRSATAAILILALAMPICYQSQTPARKLLARRSNAGFDGPDELRALGEMAAKQIPGIQNEMILGGKAMMAFYADAIDRDLPAGYSRIQLAQYMKKAGIKYLMLDYRSTRRARPELLGLLLRPYEDPFFEPVLEVRGPYPAVLFKLKNRPG